MPPEPAFGAGGEVAEGAGLEPATPLAAEPERPEAAPEPFEQTLQETVTPEEPGVPFEEVVKGFELDPGRYVMVGPEELEALEPERSRTIELEHFISLSDIDPIFFDRSYYLAPQRGGERPYALLLQAMGRAGRVGIARFVMRTRQHLAAIRPVDDVIVLETLFYADEIRELKELDSLPFGVTVDERELDLAERLIGILETEWEPSLYRDEYRERVLELIEGRASAEGALRVPEERAETPSRLAELLAALKASVEQAGQQVGQKPEPEVRAGGRQTAAKPAKETPAKRRRRTG